MDADASPARLSSPLDAHDLRARVQLIIEGILEQEGAVLARAGDDLAPLVSALTGLMTGGKRLRPAFCYWGWRGALTDSSVEPSPELDHAAMRAAASLEFLQGCALIHDDVMDGSDTRRGLPAAHHHFATLHRGSGWLGSPENFGVGAAILLGDLCLSWADQVLMSSGMPIEPLMRAKSVYDEMRTELMAGQYLDLLEQARGGGSVPRALQVVRYKSAKYTIERPLHIGAALAGASQELFDAYTAYGLPLGEAFQLRDDVLGVFGDPAQTGKPAGDDLREGKRTVLIAMAYDAASDAQAATLRAHLGDPVLDMDGIDALREIIEDTGALRSTERMIEEKLAEALTAAKSPLIAPPTQDILTGLAFAATRRHV